MERESSKCIFFFLKKTNDSVMGQRQESVIGTETEWMFEESCEGPCIF